MNQTDVHLSETYYKKQLKQAHLVTPWTHHFTSIEASLSVKPQTLTDDYVMLSKSPERIGNKAERNI
jgi:hypothetical protein